MSQPSRLATFSVGGTTCCGESWQDDRTGPMIFPFRYLIAYISTFTTRVPGDIIMTGTPTGEGARFEPLRSLVSGNVIEITADGINSLRNGGVDEAAP